MRDRISAQCPDETGTDEIARPRRCLQQKTFSETVAASGNSGRLNGPSIRTGSSPQINLMDEGESGHRLIYLSSHEIRCPQYVVQADGGPVSLPGHEVLRQQERPSLDRSERLHGNTPVQPARKRFNQKQLRLILTSCHVRGASVAPPHIRYLFAFPQAALLRCRYAIIHAFTQSPKGTAGSLQGLRCIRTLRCSRMAVAASRGYLQSLWG